MEEKTITVFSRIAKNSILKDRSENDDIVPPSEKTVGEKYGSVNKQVINKAPPNANGRMSPKENAPPPLSEMNELIMRSHRTLISISSTFPFDLFPSQITVQDSRVVFIFKEFFASSRIHSLDIADISNTFIEMSPLFATLEIVSKTFVENDVRVSNLRKKEALRVRNIIEGLRFFVKKGIDTSQYDIHTLLSQIERSFEKNRLILF